MDYSNIFMMIFVTFCFVLILIPIVIKIANHVGAMDIPNQRKVHVKPIPRLGGIGIYLGFLFGYMLFGRESIQMNAILIGSFIIIFIGIIDDINSVPAKYKFLVQLVSSAIIPFYGGIVLKDVSAFGFYFDFGFLAPYVTTLFITAIMNCINLIDGLDGLAGGISTIYFITIGIIACVFKSNGLDVTLTFVMIGSTLGFLVYNFNPAKIFMGDSGSLFLGYIISVISLLGYKNVTFTSLIVPIFLLAIPILDMTFAIIRRMLKHESITMPDKCHLHHQLLRLNFSIKKSVLIIYMVDILFAIASLSYLFGDRPIAIIVYVILTCIVLLLIFKTDIIKEHNKK